MTIEPQLATELFELLDANQNGFLGLDELTSLVRVLRPELTDAHLGQLFALADANNDGRVSFREFHAVLARLAESGQLSGALMATFRGLDVNQDGRVSCDELRRVATAMGWDPHTGLLATLFARAADESEGQVDFNQFLEVVGA